MRLEPAASRSRVKQSTTEPLPSLRLPFTTISAWLAIQSGCPDLQRTHAHFKQGTRPSRLGGEFHPGIYRWNLPVFPGMENKTQVANNGKYNFFAAKYWQT